MSPHFPTPIPRAPAEQFSRISRPGHPLLSSDPVGKESPSHAISHHAVLTMGCHTTCSVYCFTPSSQHSWEADYYPAHFQVRTMRLSTGVPQVAARVHSSLLPFREGSPPS